MSFLSPWFLFGLLGIGLPVAIHLIRREKAVRIPFSAVRFLKKAPKKSTFTHRFQQWLLMLMRVAVVALLAVAFARPFMNKPTGGWLGAAPESAVILIDTSMSMRYGDYFDRAKKKAVDILSRSSEAAIITFSDGIDQVKELTTEPSELEGFVNALDTPGYQTTRYLSALRMADQILQAARYPVKTVYLISDFQHHALENRNSDWRLSPDIRFEGIRISDPETANLAITVVKAPHRLTREKETHIIRVRVQNMGTRPIPTARISLKLNEKTVATRQVDLADQTEATVAFPVTFKNQGTHLGIVSVDGDRLSADNHYYFTTRVLAPVKILCITRTADRNWYGDDSYWFRLALGNSDDAFFELTRWRPQEFNPAELDRYDVIVLLNIGELEPSQIDGLQAYVESGGGLLLSLADQVDDRTFNRQFGKLSPAVLGRKSVRKGRNFLAVTAFDARHPIFQPIGSIDFTGARFRDYWPAIPANGAAVLMELEGGAPVFLERSVGKGRVLLFASSLDLKWNNLALDTAYLPMLHEALGYLANREVTKPTYRIGEPVPLNLSKGQLIGILDPQGREVGASVRSGNHPFFTATRVPGFYTIRTTRYREQIAVNTPALESNLTSMNPASVRKRIMNSNPKPSRLPEAPGAAAFQTQVEKSQHLWWWILLTVFILVLGETLVANRTYR